MLVNIHVTQHHINTGKPINSTKCAVSMAIDEVLNSGYYASCGVINYDIMKVDDSDNYVDNDVVDYIGRLPYFVTDFIRNFDSERSLTPIQFEIEIPEKYLKGK